MQKATSQADLAQALGLSESAVSKFKRQGMPIDSIDSARAWHARQVRPRVSNNPARLYAKQLTAIQALWPVALVALRAGQLEAVRPALQQALRAVPDEARHLVRVDVEVMDALTADFGALLGASSASGEGIDQAEPMSDSQAAAMGRAWYCVAAGVPFPAEWLDGVSP